MTQQIAIGDLIVESLDDGVVVIHHPDFSTKLDFEQARELGKFLRTVAAIQRVAVTPVKAGYARA